MKALKSRSTAAAIALVVMIAGLFFGMVRSVNAAAAKVERQFYDGVYLKDEDYTEPPIQRQLDRRADAALGLLAEANKYTFLKGYAGDLRAAREELLQADTIPGKYAANEKLEDAWRRLYDALAAHDGDVPASVKAYAETLYGAQSAIGMSRYNDMAARFDAEMTEFPAGLIRMLGLVNPPDAFGGV